MINAAGGVDSPSQIAREAQEAAPMIESLYLLGFERGEAPDGTRWVAPKSDYGHPLMRDTRELQNGAVVTAEADGVRITVDVPYAEYHQRGTERMEARPIVPSESLGERWERQIGLTRTSVPPRLP